MGLDCKNAFEDSCDIRYTVFTSGSTVLTWRLHDRVDKKALLARMNTGVPKTISRASSSSGVQNHVVHGITVIDPISEWSGDWGEELKARLLENSFLRLAKDVVELSENDVITDSNDVQSPHRQAFRRV